MVYNSWLTMQARGETDANTCQYNDLALIKLDPADAANVNPSVPYWGGPTGVGGATAQGEDVLSYGNSSLRFGVTLLSPKKGKSLGTDSGGWNHTVYTVTPGIPGDSGSGFLNASGQASACSAPWRSHRCRPRTASVTSGTSSATCTRTRRSPACSS